MSHEPQGLTRASREKMQRRLCSVVLGFEGLVVFFGALVASRMSSHVSEGAALAVGGGLALACILATGSLRSPYGIKVGWAVQVLVLATGVVVPAMFVMGVLFGALWMSALRIGDLVAEPTR
ncbi:MAG TPA: DUF4233 domain-containing protein [Sporichthyaceae bacterium]|jgi:hypothetical protein